MEKIDSYHKERLKALLPHFVEEDYGVDCTPDHNITCILDPTHSSDEKMRYYPDSNSLYCFSTKCAGSDGKRHLDIFNLVGFKYGITNYVDQVDFIINKYGYDVSTGASSVVDIDSIIANTQVDSSFYTDTKNLNAEVIRNRYTRFKECDDRSALFEYFKSRGISSDTVSRFDVVYARDLNQIIFNVNSSNTNFVTRSVIGKSYTKAGSADIFNKSVLHEQGVSIIFICEGEIDTMSFYELGDSSINAVGLGSTSNYKKLVSEVEVLANKDRFTFLLALDTDTVGCDTTAKLAEALRKVGVKCKDVAETLYLNKKDANECLLEDVAGFKGRVLHCMSLDFESDARDTESEGVKRGTSNDIELLRIMRSRPASYYESTPTGIDSLDDVIGGGLRSRLYVLGAMPGMGKSAISLFIAQNLVNEGHNVIYISTEMAYEEILCRRISRLCYDLKRKFEVPFQDVQDVLTQAVGTVTKNARKWAIKDPALIDEREKSIASAEIKLVGQKGRFDMLTIDKSDGDWLHVDKVDNLSVEIEKIIQRNSEISSSSKTVVFIDYLQDLSQILPTEDTRKFTSDKAGVDYIVSKLKFIRNKFKIPVFILSSLNRGGYKNPDLDSCKESGGIESTGEVVMFIHENAVRKWGVNQYGRWEERLITLKIAKNRGGMSGCEIPFIYRPASNYIESIPFDVENNVKKSFQTLPPKGAGTTHSNTNGVPEFEITPLFNSMVRASASVNTSTTHDVLISVVKVGVLQPCEDSVLKDKLHEVLVGAGFDSINKAKKSAALNINKDHGFFTLLDAVVALQGVEIKTSKSSADVDAVKKAEYDIITLLDKMKQSKTSDALKVLYTELFFKLGLGSIDTVAKVTASPAYNAIDVSAHITTVNYRYVGNRDGLLPYLKSLNPKLIYGLDIETSGLKAINSTACLLQIYDPAQDLVSIFRLHYDPLSQDVVTPAMSKKTREELEARVYVTTEDERDYSLSEEEKVALSKLKFVAHNAEFERSFLPFLQKLECSMLAYHAATSDSNCGLSKLTSETCIFYENKKTMQESNWRYKLTDEQLEYAAKDAKATYVLWRKYKDVNKEVYNRVHAASKIVTSYASRGLPVDIETLRVVKDTAVEVKQKAVDGLNLAGYGHLCTGKTITNKQDKLCDLPPDVKDLVSVIRKQSSLLHNTIQGVENNIFQSRLRLNVLICGTETGRFSSINPNVQNFPRKGFKHIFKASEGYTFVKADFAAQELRLAAAVSGERVLLDAFEKGIDVHANMAATINNLSYEDFKSRGADWQKAERQKAKAANFGLLYGMGAAKFVTTALDSYGIILTLEEAERIKSNFWKTYSTLKDWSDKERKRCKDRGYALTLGGRKRYFKNVDMAYCEMINTLVQGSCADILLETLLALPGDISKYLVNTVHDELVFEVPTSLVDTAVAYKEFTGKIEDAMRAGVSKIAGKYPTRDIAGFAVGSTLDLA